jgi:hypothetical protein
LILSLVLLWWKICAFKFTSSDSLCDFYFENIVLPSSQMVFWDLSKFRYILRQQPSWNGGSKKAQLERSCFQEISSYFKQKKNLARQITNDRQIWSSKEKKNSSTP